MNEINKENKQYACLDIFNEHNSSYYWKLFLLGIKYFYLFELLCLAQDSKDK